MSKYFQRSKKHPLLYYNVHLRTNILTTSIATKYIHTIRHNGGGTLKNAVVINTLVSKGMQKVIGM